MKEPKKELTSLQLFIGVFTYLMIGAGIVTAILFVWNFLVTVLGESIFK
jgi:hypothetical protein